MHSVLSLKGRQRADEILTELDIQSSTRILRHEAQRQARQRCRKLLDDLTNVRHFFGLGLGLGRADPARSLKRRLYIPKQAATIVSYFLICLSLRTHHPL